MKKAVKKIEDCNICKESQNFKSKKDTFFLRKNLKNDSFVLEHFSMEGLPEENSEIKESMRVSEKFECVETGRELKKNINEKNLKKTEEENIKDVEEKSMTKSQRIKKSMSSLFESFHSTKDQNGQNKLEVSYWEYITLFFDCFKKKTSLKNKLIRKAEKTYIEELDVVNIVTKIQDLEKLKILLLDEDQIVLFNYLSKPVLTLEDLIEESETQSPSQKRLTQCFNRKKNAKIHLEESYKNLLLRTDDKLSAKLIGFFDKEIYDYQKTK